MPVPFLDTPRLVLREPRAIDAADVLVFRGDPEVQRYNDEPLQEEAEAGAFIDFLLDECDTGRRRHWAMELRGTGAVIGMIGLHSWQHHHRRAELGYDMARAWWGRGLASEAVAAVLRHGFEAMALHRVQASTIADNVRSVRLLERHGFRREGTRRDYSLEEDGVFHDSAIYGLLREEYTGMSAEPVAEAAEETALPG